MSTHPGTPELAASLAQKSAREVQALPTAFSRLIGHRMSAKPDLAGTVADVARLAVGAFKCLDESSRFASGISWTETEHKQFLTGLQQLGKVSC